MKSGAQRHISITESLLARNSFINLAGQIIPLFVLIVTIPYVITGLGVDRFGLLSLAQIIVGYFSLFDCGLGRATTKFVADALGRDETEAIPPIVYTAFFTQLVLGAAGGLILFLSSNLAIRYLFKVPAPLVGEALEMFAILGFSIPIVTGTMSIRGAIEASQRFDLVNLVKVPSNILLFLIPAVAVFFGIRLPGIMILFILSWIASLAAYFYLSRTLYPGLRNARPAVDRQRLRPLFLFGGWVLLSNIVVPILNHSDRIFIGILVSIEAVGYYSVPFDVISRLNIIPVSVSAALFPAFAINLLRDRARSMEVYLNILRWLTIILGTLTVTVIFLARPFLDLWLGAAFAHETVVVLQVLTLGFFFNAIAQVPANLLDSIGRPDLKARTLLLYTAPFLLLLWFMVSKYGILGAAAAWTIRAAFELVVFTTLFSKLNSPGNSICRDRRIIHGFAVYVLSCVILYASQAWTDRAAVTGVLYSLWVAANACLIWYYLLNSAERSRIVTTMKEQYDR
ncbi:MAG: hypothetical protein CVU61_15740 [Deltaproteobacteria bacterium HGW-Deltaproteobacteria-19]|jgi:O-antigen/teichoic acid export membrane protein|nr:MAG: hypothetical protein CVU61_15740 [Deltaproteobacteria bacterium HGW-Deltaproteobacteria-19]